MIIRRTTTEYIPSLRECVVARPGKWFSSTDYDSGELVTHAQSCLWIVGESALADALNSGRKVHNALGATMLGLSYEEFQRRVKERYCKDARQAAKPGNFGFPGLMSAAKLVGQQRKQGPDTQCPNGPARVRDEAGNIVPGYKGLRFCILMDGADRCGVEKTTRWGRRQMRISPTCVRCLECATRLKEYWLEQWPENREYANYVQDCVENGMVITTEILDRWPWLADWFAPDTQLEPGQIMQHVTGRVRQVATDIKDSPVCAAANGFFQSALADITKSATCRISRECYDRTVRISDMQYENSNRSKFAGGPSPLLHSRLIAFMHDEIVGEHDISVACEAAERIAEIMVEEEMRFCPQLRPSCKAPAALMSKWLKSAEPWYEKGGEKPANENDRLTAWDIARAA